ncbi:hypothetical protein HW555_009362, partial [Spodoptera exigua]
MILLYKNFTYFHMHTKTRWYCSKKLSGCHARVITSKYGELVKVMGWHNHDPPRIHRSPEGKIYRSSLQFISTRFGEKLLVFENNTFCQKMSKSRWYCTNFGCEFQLIVENEKHFIGYREELPAFLRYYRQYRQENPDRFPNRQAPSTPRTPAGRVSYEVLQLLDGKSILMYQNYTYSMKGINKAYGYCSRKKTRNCNAKLKLNKDGQIVAAYTDHCHPPPKYTQMPNGLFLKIDNGVEVIQLADNGPMVYMYQNYTFAMQGAHKEYGTCSRRTSRKCKAKFKLNEYGEIISAQTYHNHPPPKLVKTSNG